MLRRKAGIIDGATLCEKTRRERPTISSHSFIDQVKNMLRFGSFETGQSETTWIEHLFRCMHESSVHGIRTKQALSLLLQP